MIHLKEVQKYDIQKNPKVKTFSRSEFLDWSSPFALSTDDNIKKNGMHTEKYILCITKKILE